MHWWGDFPIGTTLILFGIVAVVSVGSHFIGRWWDGRK
jgi:hypothetical protein